MVGDAGEQVKRTDMTRDSKETMRHGERRKFTQTARSLPARAAGARMRLVFALISVITLLATMFVTGPFQARVAVATPLANEGYGSLHRPSTGHISDNEGADNGDDRGVATWVGGNMWIGAPKDGTQQYSRVSGEQPNATYAVEAEGLTLVQGKLAMNMVKGQWREAPGQTFADSWHRQGFRFGIVGFGGQIRPQSHSTVLSVNGGTVNEAYGSNTITLYDGMNTDCMPNKNCEYKGQASDGQLVNVYGYGDTGRGFLDYYQPRSSNLQRYYADIRGSFSEPINNNGEKYENGQPTGKRNDMYTVNYSANRDTNAVIYAQNAPAFNSDAPNSTGKLTNVNWNRQNNTSLYPGTASLFSKVFHNDAYLDFSNFQEGTLEKTSNDLVGLSNTGVTDIDTNKNVQTGYVRQKYNYNSGDAHKYKLTMTFNDAYKEKVIRFTGDGVDNGQSTTGIGKKYKDGSHTQVFTLDASELNSTGYNGISFEFDRIPEDAAVVVNVVGSAPIEFHNGWRFWWNGEDISNYYVQGNRQGDRNALYSRASEAIMWNFANTPRLTVRGGVVSQGQALWESPNWSSDGGYGLKSVDEKNWAQVEDDPGAAMIGSIMVPRGTFESHVSTNGRVWVGGDFMMYNPDGLTDYAYRDVGSGSGYGHYDDISASLICMDQERHNFIWTADYTDEAAPISWNKVNSEGERIGGTKWGVYNSLVAAQNKVTQQAPINAAHTEETKNKLVTTVTDDGSGDWDPVKGTLRTGGLTKNADYYIRELEAAPGHQLNDRIYRIDTTQAANNTTIVGVWERNGNSWIEVLKPYDSMGADLSKYMLKDITPSSTSDTASRVLGIINPEYPSVEWEKVGSETGALLGGSEWKLYKKQVEDHNTSYPVIKESITDAYGTMVYLDTKAAGWPGENVTETLKICYRLDGSKEWPTSAMTSYGNGIYGVYVPSQGKRIWLSFFYETNGAKTEYRPGNGTSKDNFTSTAGQLYATVSSTATESVNTQPTTSLQGLEYADLDMRQGKFKLGGLTEGEYTLQETKAPEGYWLSNSEGGRYYTFKVELQNGQYKISWIASRITVNGQQIQTAQAATVTMDDGATVGRISNTPTEVSWWKIDADDKDSNDNVKNTVLAGSEWQLQKWSLKDNSTTEYEYRTFKDDVVDCVVTEGDSPTCANDSVDQNPEPGKFTLKRLPVGKYRLRETKAPLGYVLPSDEYIYFEVTAKASGTNDVQWKQGWASVDGSGNPTNLTQGNKAPINVNKVSDSESARAVGNTRKPGEVTWEKIAQKPQRQHKQGQVDDPDTPTALSEAENHQLLAGSEWKFEYTPYQAASGTQPTTLTIKDCMPADNGSSDVNCTAIGDSHSWAVDVNHTAGEFRISGMPWGDYVLTESKAPDGYNLDTTQHAFSIGVKQMNGNTVVGSIGNTAVSGDANQQVISINLGEIENEPGVVLPVTGAEGRHLWPAIVGALFVLASFGCAVTLRMRE